jgi:preprotein translocase subunit SecA
MISKSIERAQKKVEENNFGIRKRLIEYDDVMNKQRTVIYEKRRHALMGERIGMDISNIIWDRVVNIIDNNDFNGCKEEFLHILSMEVPFTSDQPTSRRPHRKCLPSSYRQLQPKDRTYTDCGCTNYQSGL